MFTDSPAVERLIDAFRRLPGVGKRSAERLALHVLSAPEEQARQLSEAVIEARQKIRRCSICAQLTESDPCTVCSNERRDHGVICVVEQPVGVMAIEKGGRYKGIYHVLHGVLNPLDGIGPHELGLERLFKRLQENPIEEVIIATNATAEGEATALYLSKKIVPMNIKVSRIAHGVPMGSGLEYTDEATLTHALEGRTSMLGD
jgi:recombination protein RecR